MNMMSRLLKASVRRVLSLGDLKLGRLSRFQGTVKALEAARADLEAARKDLEATRKDLEASRKELKTIRKLLVPAALGFSSSRLPGCEPKTAPPVTQIFISEAGGAPGRLLQGCVQSVKRCFPASSHKIYDNQEIESFLDDYFGKELLSTYRMIKPFAYKADLARLCILYVMGGWYVDIGVTWAIPVYVPDAVQLFAIRDRNRYCRSSWGVNNAIIFARKRHPALLRGIEIIKDNVRKGYHGVTPLCPTGPNVWGKAIAETSEPISTMFADVCELTPGHPVQNLAYVMEDGTIFAFAKPSIGGDGLVAFGETGSNSYNEFYLKRDIYGASCLDSEAR